MVENERLQTRGRRAIVISDDEGVVVDFKKLLAMSGIFINSQRVSESYSTIATVFILFNITTVSCSIYHFLDRVENCAVVVHHLMLVIDVLVVTTYFAWRRTSMAVLVSGMYMSYSYDSTIVSEFQRELEGRRIMSMRLAFKCFSLTGVFMLVNLMIFGAFEKYTRDDIPFMLLFPCWFPFDLSYLPFHIAAYCWEVVVIGMACFTVSGVMAVVFLVYSHLTTQLTLLSYALERSKDRGYELAQSNGRFNSSFSTSKINQNEGLNVSFIHVSRMCAEHHLQIIEYYNLARDVFRVLYLLVFVTGLVVCTSTGFALFSDYTFLKIKFVGVTIIQLGVIYILCWYGEEISNQSEEIRTSLIGIEWYEMPRECQTTFHLMTVRTMVPLSFTTLTQQKVDLDNYMSMVKASYSYFNLLLASQEKH